MMLFTAKTTIVAAALALALSRPSAPVSRTVRLDSNRFTPRELRANPGDTILYVNGNGGPHNVEFLADSMPAEPRARFEKAMPGGRSKLGPTSGPLLIDQEETYKIVVPDVPAGRYALVCLPHQAQMRGALIVER